MDESHSKRQTWLVCLGLALAILAAYSPLWHCQFVAFDDNDYVTSNEMVKQGLSWPGIVWAFSTVHASLWHPLTWISHMADCQLYGMNPAGHHSTSLLLHLANSILLFLLLQRMTRARWPAALTAALFALHPVHVESVAWISERKDVLSTLFWLLSVGAYVRYAEESALKSPKSRTFYVGSVVLFALGLMAKPMLVTLPFVLLLLDYWPLRRLQPPVVRLLAEKIPYFMLAGALCVVTFLAQQRGGALRSLASVPLRTRLENVPIAYARYLGKTFWPADLAVLYPLPRQWPVWEVAGATALLALITAWVIWRARAQRHLAAGWLWFLGMLAPVIGVVHFGSRSVADRYDYLPSVGLFIMIIWSAREWVCRLDRRVPVILGGLAAAGCLALTRTQAQYWQDSETLFRRALAVTEENSVMENNLGKVLFQRGRVDEALPHLLRAVSFAPDYGMAHYNLGNALLAKGKVAEALEQFEIQVNLSPGDPIAQYNFGSVLLEHGLAGDALPHLEKAVQIRPARPITITSWAMPAARPAARRRRSVNMKKPCKSSPATSRPRPASPGCWPATRTLPSATARAPSNWPCWLIDFQAVKTLESSVFWPRRMPRREIFPKPPPPRSARCNWPAQRANPRWPARCGANWPCIAPVRHSGKQELRSKN